MRLTIKIICLLCLIPAALLAMSLGVLAVHANDPGQQIYQEGILPDGKLVSAHALGDVELRGSGAACKSCHRRSGYGLTDSEVVAPPITAPALFSERLPNRAELLSGLYQEVHAPRSWAEERVPKVRPAYTYESLKRAIRYGIDPAGNPLSSEMPRYMLDDAAIDALVAYLQTLGTAPPPGVSTSQIRFATVIAGDPNPDRERAMLAVMNTFIGDHNREIARELARSDFSPYYKGEFRRLRRAWNLDVWRVTGDPANWEEQLRRRYAEAPVFAFVGGLSEGEWKPIHDFCEHERVPSIFPETELPVLNEPSLETVYLSKGLPGEAAALAEWLGEQHQASRVLQVYRTEPSGLRLAESFRDALLSKTGKIPLAFQLRATESLSDSGWKKTLAEQNPSAVAVWLSATDPAWRSIASALPEPLYASGGLLVQTGSPFAVYLPKRLQMTYPRALPSDIAPQIYRTRAWLQSRKIRDTQELIQLDTYFVMSTLEHALVHMAGRLSRDYLIETIEHETENEPNPGIYPHLTLGPEQRYASKGDYVVEVEPDHELRQLSGWIVPYGR